MDDEFLSSKSVDAKLKCATQHKHGKEEPISDCKACLLYDIVFGIWFRIKGDNQEGNVFAIIKNLPKLTNPTDSITIVLTEDMESLIS